MQPDTFFAALWREYIRITPQAKVIHDLLTARGETVLNDHVAFRTFDRSPVCLDKLEPLLLDLGYQRFAPYAFPNKHLRAFGYVHDDPQLPRVFLSELQTTALTQKNRANIETLIAAIPKNATDEPSVFWAGRLWPAPGYAQYQSLLAESEYAAWLSVWGLCANHFTVSVNALHRSPDLSQVLALIKAAGFALNTEGGEIKGSPQVLLEQGSTLADRVEFEFAGGEIQQVPSCYYEFAKRYPDESGKLYDGFVPASAERLFASTDVQPAAERKA